MAPRESENSHRFKVPLLNRGFTVSADGAQWTKVEVPRILRSDVGNVSGDAARGLFRHTVKRGETEDTV